MPLFRGRNAIIHRSRVIACRCLDCQQPVFIIDSLHRFPWIGNLDLKFFFRKHSLSLSMKFCQYHRAYLRGSRTRIANIFSLNSLLWVCACLPILSYALTQVGIRPLTLVTSRLPRQRAWAALSICTRHCLPSRSSLSTWAFPFDGFG